MEALSEGKLLWPARPKHHVPGLRLVWRVWPIGGSQVVGCASKGLCEVMHAESVERHLSFKNTFSE